MKIILVLITMGILSGCVENSATSSKLTDEQKNPDSFSPSADIVYNADYIITPYISSSFPLASSIISGAMPANPRYSIISGPSWLTIDTITGKLGVNSSINRTPASFQLEVIENGNPGNNKQSSIHTIALNGDPLTYQQWHLENTGAIKTYAIRTGTAGADVNARGVHLAGFTGSGVKVAVSDTGGELNHDDLIDNIIAGVSRDYSLTPPYIGTPTPTDAHGTAVAGIIGARGWNNKGGMGVAPLASIGIFQFLNSSQSSSILIDQASGDFDIFNYSYGDALLFDTRSSENYNDHLRHQTINQRKFFVKSSGNEYGFSNNGVCAPHNANFPFDNESPFVLTIGAINAKGDKASYSNPGSNLWVSAPGGEFGTTDPAILTADLPTCFKGFSKATNFQVNDFEYNHPENTKCNYTSVMNGTSAAAPMVSGVIALILEANPALSYRDVKHILAMSAKKTDPTHSNVFGKSHPSHAFTSCSSTLDLAGHEYEQGWVANARGIEFNNFYGFGLVDASAAVSLAQNFNQVGLDPLLWLPLPTLVETNPNFNISNHSTGSIDLLIPDNNATGVTSSITPSVNSNLKVETIQISLTVDHDKSGQVGVELTSPSGTKSILSNINNSFLLNGDSDLNMVLTSHAFYGEDATGAWTVKLIDGRSGTVGKLTSWNINIVGHIRP